MKRHVMSWNDFKKKSEILPLKKGKSKAPENAKKKDGKSSAGIETLDDVSKISIPSDKKTGKKGTNTVLDTPKKTKISDESSLKNATVKKDVMDTKIPVSKKAVPTVKKATTPNVKTSIKKLKA